MSHYYLTTVYRHTAQTGEYAAQKIALIAFETSGDPNIDAGFIIQALLDLPGFRAGTLTHGAITPIDTLPPGVAHNAPDWTGPQGKMWIVNRF